LEVQAIAPEWVEYQSEKYIPLGPEREIHNNITQGQDVFQTGFPGSGITWCMNYLKNALLPYYFVRYYDSNILDFSEYDTETERDKKTL